MKILFSLLALMLAVPAFAADVKITITGLRSTNGHVLVDLHDQPSAFPDAANRAFKSAKVKASASTVTFWIRGVPPGEYAFSYIHDENDNDHMDNNNFGFPLEGFGFSRDPAVRFSAPKFLEASFVVDEAGANLVSHVKYL